MHVLVNLEDASSSGVRVGEKHVDVDTSMRIVVVENLFFSVMMYILWNQNVLDAGTNVLLHNLKLLWRLNSLKYSLASSRVRWLNGE